MADLGFLKEIVYASAGYVLLLYVGYRVLGKPMLPLFRSTVVAASGAAVLGAGAGVWLDMSVLHALGYGLFFGGLAASGWIVYFSGNWGILLGVVTVPFLLIFCALVAPSAVLTDAPTARDLQLLWILAAALLYAALAIARWMPGPWARWRPRDGQPLPEP